jgi:hypothetical protein
MMQTSSAHGVQILFVKFFLCIWKLSLLYASDRMDHSNWINATSAVDCETMPLLSANGPTLDPRTMASRTMPWIACLNWQSGSLHKIPDHSDRPFKIRLAVD